MVVFRSERLRTFMEAWLTAHAIQPVARPEWQDENPTAPESEGTPDSSDEVPKSQGGRRARTAEMLRQQLKELGDTLGPRDLDVVVSFGEFLKARRAARGFVHHQEHMAHDSGGHCRGFAPGSVARHLRQYFGVVTAARCRALVGLAVAAAATVAAPCHARPSGPLGKLDGGLEAPLSSIAELEGGLEAPPASMRVDWVVATIYAPEMGGAAHPHFVLERLLALEARVVVLLDCGEIGARVIEERDAREGFDHVIAGEILSVLATKVQGDSWGEEGADERLEETVSHVTEATVERAGGRQRLDEAARIENVDSSEVDAMLRREALAAFYLDRAVIPILRPADEQLREAYRMSAHPFRGRPFDEVRDALSRWLLVGRLRAAETAFLQAARSRIRVVMSS